uniref:Uncharacterized protein n=1 Tax=viral metagenome TaxID=1070528 RepID=A0A6C0LQ75_9ZZZZ
MNEIHSIMDEMNIRDIYQAYTEFINFNEDICPHIFNNLTMECFLKWVIKNNPNMRESVQKQIKDSKNHLND